MSAAEDSRSSGEGLLVGIDCGGTNLRAAAALSDGSLVAEVVVPTGDAEERRNGLGEAIRALVREAVEAAAAKGGPSRVRGIGVGLPFVCHDGRAWLCRNVGALDPAWLEAALREDHGAPAALLNDVKCAALGESWLGAARGASSFVFLNVGTGLAAAVMHEGRLVMGSHNAAGEIGYWVAEASDPKGFSEGKGPLEQAMSGVGLADAWEEASGGRERLDAERVFALAAAGDARAKAIVERGFSLLLPAIANLATLLDPGLLVIGGGVAKSLEARAAEIEAYLARMTPFPPRLAFSDLGGRAGLLGAVRLAELAATSATAADAATSA